MVWRYHICHDLLGFVYVAFVHDSYSRKIVGYNVSDEMTTTLPLVAVSNAINSRNNDGHNIEGLIHHSDKGSQYVSIQYRNYLDVNSVAASTGTTGDSYDNAQAESLNGLYKSELIWNRCWRDLKEVEWETLLYVDWFNNRRIHGSIDNDTPVEHERKYYDKLKSTEEKRCIKNPE